MDGERGREGGREGGRNKEGKGGRKEERKYKKQTSKGRDKGIRRREGKQRKEGRVWILIQCLRVYAVCLIMVTVASLSPSLFECNVYNLMSNSLQMQVMDNKLFTVDPRKGTLAPGQSKTVILSYR